jgi:ankyrin repeat protein
MTQQMTTAEADHLVRAAMRGERDFVLSALASGAPADTIGALSHGETVTLLFVASVRRDVVLTNALLAAGAKPNIVLAADSRITNARTALNQAIAEGSPEIAYALLDAGADPRIVDADGETAAHRLFTYLDKYRQLANGEEVFASLLSCLIDKGVPVNRVTFPHAGQDSTLLRKALNPTVPISVVEMLLERGADLQMYDGNGRQPIHLAAQRGNVAALRLLVERGADVNAADHRGQTALWCFASDVFGRELLGLGADIEHQDVNGRTALMHIVSKLERDDEIPQAALTLLAGGASADIVDIEGSTARMQIEARDLQALKPYVWARDARIVMHQSASRATSSAITQV